MHTEHARRGDGRGVRIAVIDSGVHESHPHVGRIAGGVALESTGGMSSDYVDRIGHGTAVMAAIREKAPESECYAVRIFDRRLSTSTSTLLAAIDWAVGARMHIINLSLGTANASHVAAYEAAVARATDAGVRIVSARDDDAVAWFPGSLPGVVPVQVDWTCPRDQFHAVRLDGTTVYRTSGFARPIPGVDPWRNLHGISFAVANMTGFIAQALSLTPDASVDEALRDMQATSPFTTQHRPEARAMSEVATSRADR
jgi:subtilisin family serine protease